MTPSNGVDEMLAQLPKPEMMLTYASILEKPQYWIDKSGHKFLLQTGEIVEAACAALRLTAALRASARPAVEGVESALVAELQEFDSFLNEPPAYEDQIKVREYRHAAKPAEEGQSIVEKCAAVCDHWIGSKNLHEHLAAADIKRLILKLSTTAERNPPGDNSLTDPSDMGFPK